MEGVNVQTIVQAFGPAGMFIAYLMWQAKLARQDAEARRIADVQLALALERFCRKFTGQSLTSQGDDHVQ